MEKLDQLKERSQNRFVSPYMLALVYSFLPDKEKMLELLEESLAFREPWLCCLPVEARFETIFNEARFQAILKAVSHPLCARAPYSSEGAATVGAFGERTTVLMDDVS
jgi:hypothetical protein